MRASCEPEALELFGATGTRTAAWRSVGLRGRSNQDLDHVGSGAALVRQSGARVLAHAIEAPYIGGELKLVAGDALTAEGDRLNGPNSTITSDMEEAARSAKRLAELDVEIVVCYHGGVVSEDANGQLRRVVEESSGNLDG